MKILVADDNVGSRRRLKAILEQVPYTVLEADDGDEAFALAVREHPHLIIVNAELQGEEGYRLCARLNQSGQSADIPVLLLSGWTLSIGSLRGLELGAIDYITRPFNERDILTKVKNYLNIHQMSESLLRAREELLEKERETEESLQSAAVIQQSLLPVSTPKATSFDFAWRFMPCEQVGGDLFNVFKLDETHLGAYVMDVSGHGVPAAMVTTSVAQALNPLSGQFLKRMTNSPPYYELVSPAEVLSGLNREYPIERFEKYLTICYILLDTQSGKVRYSNAGHPLPLLIRADGQTEKLSAGGTIIGIGEGAAYEEGEASMSHGDRLFIYTDGIVEHPNERGEFYGEERLVRELQAFGGKTLQMACARVINSLRSFGSGRQPEDDITLLGIEYRPG